MVGCTKRKHVKQIILYYIYEDTWSVLSAITASQAASQKGMEECMPIITVAVVRK